MATPAADDFTTIRRSILRLRVIAIAVAAGLEPSAVIPKEMFLAAGYTPEEYAAFPTHQTQLPIGETDLR
jgi:hypothetical protein